MTHARRIHVMARYTVRRARVAAIRRAVGDLVAAVARGEPDTLVYEVFQEPDGISFVHLMAFRSRRAERRHAASRHVGRFTRLLLPSCTQRPVFTRLRLTGGHHAQP